MTLFKRLLKLGHIASHPRFARAAAVERVAAATEHLAVIRYTQAATLIDVGANKGQFSLAFRALRPDAQIYAFEPLHQAADRFEKVFSGDKNCILKRVALSDAPGHAEFHVTNREDSSSLLKPGTSQRLAFGVTGDRSISVEVATLDDCIDFEVVEHPVLLKIDVQGAELDVVRGCSRLSLVDFIYAELSFVELYEGQPLFNEAVKVLAELGFVVRGIFNPVNTRRFGPTQVDVLFARPGALDWGPPAEKMRL